MAKAKGSPTKITDNQVQDFYDYLVAQERAEKTREKYLANLRQYERFLGDRVASHETFLLWREVMQDVLKYSVSTINTKISSVNAFFHSIGHSECTLKLLKSQTPSYREDSLDLTRKDCAKLVRAARENGREETACVLNSLSSTGVRVSELTAFTAEALQAKELKIFNKGKGRKIRIPNNLLKQLKAYAKSQGILQGPIFLNKRGLPLTRHQVWEMLKWAASLTDVDSAKVFPHNFRHLFAREHFKKYGDIALLADTLGHSSIETTRIYLRAPASEQARKIDELNLTF